MTRFATILYVLLLGVFGAACSTRIVGPPRVLFDAQVVYLYRDAQRTVLRHNGIRGWYQAGLTEFLVKDADEYAKLRVGDRIKATFVTDGGSEHIENIAQADPLPGATRR